ncbi:MAG: AAA family ATPase [Mariprofundales bacterium]|nr:AAA family ATPase [Mariprofundales bacterium]
MYLNHWKLTNHPFDDVADSSFFVTSPTTEMLCADLHQAIVRRRGAIMMTGEIGCGKTTISQQVLLQLQPERYDIAWVTNARLQPEPMLREIAHQLNLELSGSDGDNNHLMRQLQNQMIRNAEQGRDSVICIDEAQGIPSLDTFEELRIMLNFQLDCRFLVTIFLIGQPELKGIIAKIPQLKQRLALDLMLGKYSLAETTHYMLHRLRVAGCNRPILTRQAALSVFRHTQGIPRRVNHLMDHCLTVGMRENASAINDKLVALTVERYPY